jgi:hypothetical protein
MSPMAVWFIWGEKIFKLRSEDTESSWRKSKERFLASAMDGSL